MKSANDVESQGEKASAELTKVGRGAVKGLPGSDGDGKGSVGGRSVGNTGSDGLVVGLGLNDNVRSTVGGDSAELGVELGGETSDDVRVFRVEAASSSVAVLC